MRPFFIAFMKGTAHMPIKKVHQAAMCKAAKKDYRKLHKGAAKLMGRYKHKEPLPQDIPRGEPRDAGSLIDWTSVYPKDGKLPRVEALWAGRRLSDAQKARLKQVWLESTNIEAFARQCGWYRETEREIWHYKTTIVVSPLSGRITYIKKRTTDEPIAVKLYKSIDPRALAWDKHFASIFRRSPLYEGRANPSSASLF